MIYVSYAHALSCRLAASQPMGPPASEVSSHHNGVRKDPNAHSQEGMRRAMLQLITLRATSRVWATLCATCVVGGAPTVCVCGDRSAPMRAHVH